MASQFVNRRRTFIKGASAAVLGITALAGSAIAENDTVTDVNDIVWDEEYDVLIAGAGAAGLAAAVTVATEGEGATALLLEKGSAPWGNGNSVFSSGLCTYTDDVESYAEYLKEMRGDFTATPDDVLEAFAVGLRDNYSWVVNDLGADPDEIALFTDEDYATEWPELPHAGGRLMFQFKKTNESDNTHLVKFFSNLIDTRFSDVVSEKTNSPLLALIQDPTTKAVMGGVYQGETGNVYAKARRGVIMCTGGFGNDDTMKQDFLSFPISHPAAGECNTGDGHRICAKLGASFWHMNNFAGSWTNAIKLDGSEMLAYRGLRKAQGITVGVNGRRFYSDWEGSTMFNRIEPGSDLSLQYGCRHGKQNFGGDYTHLPMPTTTWFVFDAEGLTAGAYLGAGNTGSVASQNTASTNNTADPVADGYGYTADTIEELAELCGMPAEELAKTVETWNNSCANGEDEYFHRASNTLKPIAVPPFYAVKCVPEILNTDGGPRRNAAGQILDVDGDPIPNLYSAGEFGSVWSNKYEGCGNIGECCAFGRISARNVLSNTEE